METLTFMQIRVFHNMRSDKKTVLPDQQTPNTGGEKKTSAKTRVTKFNSQREELSREINKSSSKNQKKTIPAFKFTSEQDF